MPLRELSSLASVAAAATWSAGVTRAPSPCTAVRSAATVAQLPPGAAGGGQGAYRAERGAGEGGARLGGNAECAGRGVADAFRRGEPVQDPARRHHDRQADQGDGQQHDAEGEDQQEGQAHRSRHGVPGQMGGAAPQRGRDQGPVRGPRDRPVRGLCSGPAGSR